MAGQKKPVVEQSTVTQLQRYVPRPKSQSKPSPARPKRRPR